MLRRLRRPGYRILLLLIVTVYFYHLYQKHEEECHRQAMLNLYRTYGENILGQMREGNFSGVQSLFPTKLGEVFLEDIALFVQTLHLDRHYTTRWEEVRKSEGNVTMSGKILFDDNLSYPIDMMMVVRGREILLNRVHIGPGKL